MTTSIEIETQGDHQYVVRLREGEDTCESWFHITPAVLDQVRGGDEAEEQVVQRTAEFLTARQSVADFPEIVELEDVISTYDDFIEVMTRQAPPPPPARDGRSPRDEHWVGPRPLADEHAILLHEVRSRGRLVRTAISAGRSPDHEVAGLVDYLRFEVLDQAVAAERLLFPLVGEGLADGRIQALLGDHVRLRDLTAQLSDAGATSGDRQDPRALVELLDSLDEFLDRHMHTEQAVLSVTTSSGVESLRHPFRCHLWFPLTEGPEVDLDVLPRAFERQAAVERFSRLRPGERLIVESGHDLDGLWNVLACERPREYGWAYLDEGPERWRAEVTRRTTD